MSASTSSPPQNFDEWAALAQSDPRAFEARRSQVIDQAIRKAPAHKQQRLRCIQWRLDTIRLTSRTPMVACLRMNHMLWEAVIGDNGLLNCLQQPDAARHRSGGTVIAFKRPHNPHIG